MNAKNNTPETETIIEYLSTGNVIKEVVKESNETEINDQQAEKKSVPGVILITDEGHSLIGRLSSTAPDDGPTFPVGDGRFAWNADTKDLVCLGRHGKGIVFNLNKRTKSDPFRLEGGNHISKVKWNADKNHFIAVGDQGSVYLSEDARQWQKQEVPLLARLTDISWSAKLQIYVAIGDKGTLITSADGKSWNIQKCEFEKSPAEYDLSCIERSDEWNRFVVLHKNSDYQKRSGLLTSADGLNWEYHTEVIPSGTQWRSIAWSRPNKKFVVVGDNRSIISSNEGLTWSGQQLKKRNILVGSPNFHFNEVIYNSWINAFVAVGTEFTAYYSFNGNTDENTINRDWLNLTASKWTFNWIGFSHEFINVSECDYYV